MAESDVNERQAHVSSFLRDLSIRMDTGGFEDMRAALLALDSVDTVLASLRKECGLQIYSGIDIVEEYKRSRQEPSETPVPEALDYIVRKGAVELQLQVRLAPRNGFVLPVESVEQYARVLGANPKTQELVLVWATPELHSLALGLDDIRDFQRRCRQEEGPIAIAPEELTPLRDTIKAALRWHRPILQKPTDLGPVPRGEFDLLDTFSRTFAAELAQLRSSAPRRRAEERRLAILSISQSDAEQILSLFADAQAHDVEFDELSARIAAISEHVQVEPSKP